MSVGVGLASSEFAAGDAAAAEQSMDALILRVVQQESLAHNVAVGSEDSAAWTVVESGCAAQCAAQFDAPPVYPLEAGGLYLSRENGLGVSVREAAIELCALDPLAAGSAWGTGGDAATRLRDGDDGRARSCNLESGALLELNGEKAGDAVVASEAPCFVPTSGVVDALETPSIVVGQGENWLSISPTVVPLWERLSLHPYVTFCIYSLLRCKPRVSWLPC